MLILYFPAEKKNTLQRELILNFMRCTILQSFYHKVNLQWSDYDIPYGASRDMKYKRKKKKHFKGLDHKKTKSPRITFLLFLR